jgi:hypothetical protein
MSRRSQDESGNSGNCEFVFQLLLCFDNIYQVKSVYYWLALKRKKKSSFETGFTFFMEKSKIFDLCSNISGSPRKWPGIACFCLQNAPTPLPILTCEQIYSRNFPQSLPGWRRCEEIEGKGVKWWGGPETNV